jgi:hypothetical protein
MALRQRAVDWLHSHRTTAARGSDQDPTDSRKLCDKCSSMELSLIRPSKTRQHLEGIEYSLTWTFKHYSSYKQLKRSASHGCEMCSAFLAGLLASCPESGELESLKSLADEEAVFKACLVPGTLPPLGNTSLLQFTTIDEALSVKFLLTSPTGMSVSRCESEFPSQANTSQWTLKQTPRDSSMASLSYGSQILNL